MGKFRPLLSNPSMERRNIKVVATSNRDAKRYAKQFNVSFRPIQILSVIALLLASFVFVLVQYTKYQRHNDPLAHITYSTFFDKSRNLFWSEKWIEQRVDHFAWTTTKDWNDANVLYKQRYLINDKNWDPNDPKAPIFFYTGNEGDVTLYANNTGLMWEHAAHFSALIVFAEHRYYGLSQPFNSSNLDSSQLRFLTHEQALADYAVLLYNVQKEYRASGHPVIVFGGSYGGMLSAWFRIRYPTLVQGAIASSAPIFGFPKAYKFIRTEDYFRIVTRNAQVEAGADKNCATNVRKSWPILFKMAESSAGLINLSSIFQMCQPLQSPSHISNLAIILQDTFVALAMANYPYPSNYIMNGEATLPAWPMRHACSFLAKEYATNDTDGAKLLKAVAQAVSVYFNASGQFKCLQIPPPETAVDIYDYQYCTEMLPISTYFDTNGFDDMFWNQSSTFDTIVRNCQATWGTTPDPYWIRALYGDAKNLLSSASNIVFTNGNLDPWSSLGVSNLPVRNRNVQVLQIDQSAHHLDLFFHHINDPKSVVDARYVQVRKIREWIDQYYEQRHLYRSDEKHHGLQKNNASVWTTRASKDVSSSSLL